MKIDRKIFDNSWRENKTINNDVVQHKNIFGTIQETIYKAFL
ncbi:hypothetical protein [Metamycoplasma gateae]|uniref:Uncharacterized protein n=1 Tax=Metamycoplasma gateae TaxID=35769 RepID=A0ABZ2AKZ6_9BACT|nr:hypothetical protein V2E26_00075 [Metamycoplasma gateae]